MRASLALLCLLTSVAYAQGYPEVSDDAAEAALAKVGADLEDADEKALDAAWRALQPMLGARGVFDAEDTTGLDDAGTQTRRAIWRTGAALKTLRGPIMSVVRWADTRACAASECTMAASHFETTLALRKGPGGHPVIVGVFQTNSLLDAAGQAANAASLAQWRAAVAQRYPASTGAAPIGPAGDRANARALNAQGLKALKAKNLKGAVAAFKQAVKADPSHYLARYNLACAYSLAGQATKALGILAEFKAAKGCPACQVRVARAAKDADFKALRANPAFKAIVAGAKVPKTDVKAASVAIDRAFGGTADLTPFIDPLRPVTVAIKGSISGETKTTTVDGQALSAYFNALSEQGVPGLNGMEGMTCDATCCTSAEHAMGHNNLYLQRVCLKADGAGWATVRRVEIIDGD